MALTSNITQSTPAVPATAVYSASRGVNLSVQASGFDVSENNIDFRIAKYDTPPVVGEAEPAHTGGYLMSGPWTDYDRLSLKTTVPRSITASKFIPAGASGYTAGAVYYAVLMDLTTSPETVLAVVGPFTVIA